MIRAVIFDFDGTILDTEAPILQAWQRTYAQHGEHLTLQEYSAAVGTDYSVFDPRGTLEQRIGRKLDWTALDNDRRNYHLELVGQKPILPGIRNLLVEVKARGLLCAIASSSTSDWVESHLQRLGLRDYFDFISCANPPLRPKPETDVYLQVLKHFGMTAREAIAIEDSPHGLTAAQTAGIPCVGVPNEITIHLPFPAGTIQLPTLENVTLEALLELLKDGQAPAKN